ncbi:MAG TPA: hypothetical protein VNT51_04710 [Miltoncostaeaceae bacterium]|jgi:hypothetical protein|nr:hypothetical protein [Miltoncostaeaceae bacterium]
MRRLPPWMIFFLFVLTALMIWVGVEERHHVGPLPLVLGVAWLLFTLAAAGGMFRAERD